MATADGVLWAVGRETLSASKPSTLSSMQARNPASLMDGGRLETITRPLWAEDAKGLAVEVRPSAGDGGGAGDVDCPTSEADKLCAVNGQLAGSSEAVPGSTVVLGSPAVAPRARSPLLGNGSSAPKPCSCSHASAFVRLVVVSICASRAVDTMEDS